MALLKKNSILQYVINKLRVEVCAFGLENR